MDSFLRDLYVNELECKRLRYDRDADYTANLEAFSQRYELLFAQNDHRLCEELWSKVFSLSDSTGRISFAHGLRLGLRLAWWAGGGAQS